VLKLFLYEVTSRPPGGLQISNTIGRCIHPQANDGYRIFPPISRKCIRSPISTKFINLPPIFI